LHHLAELLGLKHRRLDIGAAHLDGRVEHRPIHLTAQTLVV
jgi:hypothetical protein